MIIPETKAINNAIASFLFMGMNFDLQSNGFFSEKLSYLQKFLESEINTTTTNCKLTTDN
jgi:hypothetical protein